jgi:hypothetical protein
MGGKVCSFPSELLYFPTHLPLTDHPIRKRVPRRSRSQWKSRHMHHHVHRGRPHRRPAHPVQREKIVDHNQQQKTEQYDIHQRRMLLQKRDRPSPHRRTHQGNRRNQDQPFMRLRPRPRAIREKNKHADSTMSVIGTIKNVLASAPSAPVLRRNASAAANTPKITITTASPNPASPSVRCTRICRAEINAVCTISSTIQSVNAAPCTWISRFGKGAATIPARK